MTAHRVTGVMLAAGRSSRLGAPKQLLPFRDTTVGGAAAAVSPAVALDGVDVVVVDDPGSGCSSSLRAALPKVDPLATGIVLLLGDQPGVATATVERLIAEGGDSPIAVCRYTDGVGHPFWLHRSVFGELDRLHGDKGIWKLIESGRVPVRELAVEGTVPPALQNSAMKPNSCV